MTNSIFATYKVTLDVRKWLCGGIPKDPAMLQGWIMTKAFGDDRQAKQDLLRQQMVQLLLERGQVPNENATIEDLFAMAKDFSDLKHTVGFHRYPLTGNPYIEGRQVKAMLKEAVNVIYAAGTRGPEDAGLKKAPKRDKDSKDEKESASMPPAFGDSNPTRKGGKNWFEERVFVEEDDIPIGLADDVRVQLFIAHTSGPTGPQSSLTFVEYVEQPTITFTLKVMRDHREGSQSPTAVDGLVREGDWVKIWEVAQEIGLGAKRSQSFGRFNLTDWTALPDEENARFTVASIIARAKQANATVLDHILSAHVNGR